MFFQPVKQNAHIFRLYCFILQTFQLTFAIGLDATGWVFLFNVIQEGLQRPFAVFFEPPFITIGIEVEGIVQIVLNSGISRIDGTVMLILDRCKSIWLQRIDVERCIPSVRITGFMEI